MHPGIALCWNDNCTDRKAPTSDEEAGSSDRAEKAQLNSGKDLLCFEQHKRACDCQGLYERSRWTDVQLLTPPADAQPNSAKRKREEAELNSEQHKTAKKKRGRPRKHALPEGSGSKPGTADAQLLTPPAMPAEPEPAEEAGSSDPAERAHDIAEFSESWRDSSSHESHEVPLGCIRGPGSCIVRQCVGSACDEIVWQARACMPDEVAVSLRRSIWLSRPRLPSLAADSERAMASLTEGSKGIKKYERKPCAP